MTEGSATALQCPACAEGVRLVAVDRNGVVIDACPRCRGVWLDRGELDKLIDLEGGSSGDFLEEIRGGSARRDSGGDEQGSNHGSGSGHGSKGKRKRGSFLGEIFDIG